MSDYPYINLTGLKSCKQQWAQMPEIEGGRLCQSCHKCIVDFRGKSPKEIALIHASSQEPVCGVYTKKQLQLPIPPRQYKIPKIQSWLFAITAFFTADPPEAMAQKPPVEQRDIKPSETIKQTHIKRPTGKLWVRGRITQTQETGEPEGLPFANVILKRPDGSIIAVMATDIDGYYRVDYHPDKETSDSLTIEVQMIGYVRISRTFASTQNHTLDFQMSGSTKKLQDTTITIETAFYAEVPQPNFFQQTYQWLVAPFQGQR